MLNAILVLLLHCYAANYGVSAPLAGGAVVQITESVRKFSFSALLDYFIPREIQVQPDTHRRARMFMLSHVCGPFLGNVIPLYLYFVEKIPADYRFWIFFGSVTTFWLYPLALRYTRVYRTLAFISIQNLIFCILWACFSYGGIYSPFLPWVLVIPVLSFLYLPATGVTRAIILTQICVSVGAFEGLVLSDFAFPPVDLEQFQIIGLISIISASIYVIIMALYFANFFREQTEFAGELSGLVTTADNLRNLTESARQATAAKAEFVASMSHELRTPLNAVIGYSQLLLDDLEDSGVADEEFVADVRKIWSAGTQLLSLIDDILDFSKIEAEKMQTHPSVESLSRAIGLTISDLNAKLEARQYSIACVLPEAELVLRLDWYAFGKSLSHIIAGITSADEGGKIDLLVRHLSDEDLLVEIVDPKQHGTGSNAGNLFDIFADASDASSTKYGGVGISLALSQKFAELCGGGLAASERNGKRVFVMTIPAPTSA
jgi:signal transduction histidine kinase